jgi:hypothetical protein
VVCGLFDVLMASDDDAIVRVWKVSIYLGTFGLQYMRPFGIRLCEAFRVDRLMKIDLDIKFPASSYKFWIQSPIYVARPPINLSNGIDPLSLFG